MNSAKGVSQTFDIWFHKYLRISGGLFRGLEKKVSVVPILFLAFDFKKREIRFELH